MPIVTIRENEPLEGALRRFKRKCERSGVLSEVRRRRCYEKPSVRRKAKEIAARKKLFKRLSVERRLQVA